MLKYTWMNCWKKIHLLQKNVHSTTFHNNFSGSNFNTYFFLFFFFFQVHELSKKF